MPTVKGSKQERMVVVPYRPLRTFLLRFSVLCITVGLVAVSYIAGRDYGINANTAMRAERDQLLASFEEASRQLAALERLRLGLEQASALDRRALEEVQGALIGLREKNASLEEELLFYRHVMAPDSGDTGLVISQLDLRNTGEQNRVGYRLELRQQMNSDSPVSGFANINVVGRRNQEEVSLPLHSLSESAAESDIRLQFRYFQNIEGEILIPEDFEPHSVQITAVSEGANARTVERSFNWLPE